MSNEALAIRAKAGDSDALLALWEQVRRLVYRKALRVRLALGDDRLADLDDLMQAAFLGLLAAVERFDPDAGYSFTTILGNTLKTAFAEATGYRSGRQQRDPMRGAVSLDEPLEGDDPAGDTRGDLVADPRDQMEEVAERLFRDWRRETVQAAVNRLPPEEGRAVRLRYFARLTLAETARREGVAPREIRQRQERAFRALRHSLRRYTDLRTNFYCRGPNPVEANVLRREELAERWA